MADPGTGQTARPLEPELAEWMRSQRWFAGKGGSGDLTVLGSFPLPAAEPGVTIETRLVLHSDSRSPALYQVPLVLRRGEAADAIASIEGLAVLDGPRDPAYPAALL